MLPRKIRINRDIGNILCITLPVDLECAAMTAGNHLEQE